MKTPKFKVGDIVVQATRNNWRREITEVIHDYLDKPGRFGYFYIDPDYQGAQLRHGLLCSEEHLIEWSKR